GQGKEAGSRAREDLHRGQDLGKEGGRGAVSGEIAAAQPSLPAPPSFTISSCADQARGWRDPAFSSQRPSPRWRISPIWAQGMPRAPSSLAAISATARPAV